MNLNRLMLAAAFLLIGATSCLNADIVVYRFTLDATLNNASGTWGGDLNVGAGQDVNLTVDYYFDRTPIVLDTDKRQFLLTALQVFDNTNGLASALLSGGGGINFQYDFSGNDDRQIGASFGDPGGSFFSWFEGNIGSAGEPAPVGTSFDDLVNAAGLDVLIARAADAVNDNVGGLNGVEDLQPGEFSFSSHVVPEPAQWLACAVISLGTVCRRRRCP